MLYEIQNKADILPGMVIGIKNRLYEVKMLEDKKLIGVNIDSHYGMNDDKKIILLDEFNDSFISFHHGPIDRIYGLPKTLAAAINLNYTLVLDRKVVWERTYKYGDWVKGSHEGTVWFEKYKYITAVSTGHKVYDPRTDKILEFEHIELLRPCNFPKCNL